MNRFLRFFLCFIIFYSATALRADDFSGSDTAVDTGNFTGSETHDGFYFRFLYGFGKASVTEKEIIYGDLKLSGMCGVMNLQFGGAPVDNLILFGDLTSVAVVDPKVEWGRSSGTAQNTTLGIVGFGGGMTYYIMPENFYLSASVSFPIVSLKVNNTQSDSDTGKGIKLSLGKEWWVSDNWGLGVALVGSVFETTVNEVDLGKKDMTGWYWGICFSATYN